MLHATRDVLPYWVWGNTPGDKHNTRIDKRIHPKLYNFNNKLIGKENVVKD